MRKRIGLWFLVSALACVSAGVGGGQEAAAESTGPAVQAPAGFRGIDLGMDLETVKNELLEDPFFDYRGEPDVSFLPQTRESLIECAGLSYISRAYFQFHEKKLYIMILVLDEKKIDHYSLFATLTDKYGPFSSLSPAKVVWETENTLFSLERPLTVKYLDRGVFESLKAEGAAEENLRSVSRSRFLEEF
jgi:hypothetical protein